MMNLNPYLNNYCTHLYNFVNEISEKTWFTQLISRPEYANIKKEYLKLIFLAYKTSSIKNHQEDLTNLIQLRKKTYSFIDHFNELSIGNYTENYLKMISEISKIKK